MNMSAPARADLRVDTASMHALLRLALGRPLPPAPHDWPGVLALAEQERLLGVAWKRSAETLRRDAPGDVAVAWQRRAVILGLSVERQLELLAKAIETLSNRGVAAIVLKGFPLAQRIYGDYTVRPILDSDLYVPADQRAVAATALGELGWRCTAGIAPEEERYERRVGSHTFVIEVHSSALDDPLLDHIEFPVERRWVAVGGHALPAHSGRFVPSYIAAHLAKHHEKPLLWALDFFLLWSSLDVTEQRDAIAAARTAGLDAHLRWAIDTTTNIDACARELSAAEPGLRRLRGGLTTSGDARRVLRLVTLSDSPAAALRVVGGRVWPLAWRRSWREAPGYFLRRAIHWLYRHLVFERPSAGIDVALDESSIALAAADSETRLRDLLSVRPVWVSPADGSMEPAIPRFAFARIVSAAAIDARRGDVVVVRDEHARCALRRVTRLADDDDVGVRADARFGREELVPRAALLGVCDVVDVGGKRESIASRPHGAWKLLQAILRGRRRSAKASERLMYVYDFGAASLGSADTPVRFTELTPDEIRERQTTLRAGGQTIALADTGESGCVAGTLAGRLVYHVWYVRADGTHMQRLPNAWRPRGRVLFLHGGFTHPEFRGRGIHSAALRWLLARDQRSDVAHAVGVVNADNEPARRAVEAVGFRAVGRVS
jgi:RimJ/RimL family protein N-acetyltransferase